MGLPLPFPASTISLNYGAVDGTYYTASSPHQGTDFSSRSQGVVAGEPFGASGVGRVVRSGYGPVGVSPSISRPNNLGGNSIDVDYGAFVARYMHRPDDSPSPSVGTVTFEGLQLGVVGATGLVSAAHLHMETWDKSTGRRVDPARFFDFNRHVGDATASADSARPFTPESTSRIGGKMTIYARRDDGLVVAIPEGGPTHNYTSPEEYNRHRETVAVVNAQRQADGQPLVALPPSLGAIVTMTSERLNDLIFSQGAVLSQTQIVSIPTGPAPEINLDEVAAKVNDEADRRARERLGTPQ